MSYQETAVHNNDDEDWEEWDGRSPFWMHCVAGSCAGMTEHVAVYPLDTVRTHIQVCASCLQRGGSGGGGGRGGGGGAGGGGMYRTLRGASKGALSAAGARHSYYNHSQQLPTGMWQTIRFLVNEPPAPALAAALPGGGPPATAAAGGGTLTAPAPAAAPPRLAVRRLLGCARLWRGVQTVLIGCVPAHALYFSSYETIKAAATDGGQREMTFAASSAAGAAAVFSHDAVLTPLDTVKQRMQLGHHRRGILRAVNSIASSEGYGALYRSLPVTLATNVPYGMVMVSVNEWAKLALTSDEHHHFGSNPTWQTIVAASALAGFTASAVTTPLDRIKTALQTQALRPAHLTKAAATTTAPPRRRSAINCLVQHYRHRPKRHVAAAAASTSTKKTLHADWQQAAYSIWRQEGVHGFYRGMLPRVLSHTPAAAISWTTYETCKQYLLKHYGE